MKSLKKLLLGRFILIVLAHTLLVLLAVYGITFLNISSSTQWEMNRFEKRLINCIEENQPKERFLELVSSLNNGEERQIKFGVFENGRKIFGGLEKVKENSKKSSVTFNSYKKWTFEKSNIKNGRVYLIQFRASLDFIDDTLWILFLSLPLTLIPAMIFANKSFKTVVEPVREISSTLAKVEKGDLSKRVDGGAKNEEIDTLIKRMNEALSALEESFSHSERFNANAAHELKTPLASLRGEIDVCLQKDRSQDEYEVCLTKCQQEIHHLDEVLKVLLLISGPGDSMKGSFKEFNLAESYKECEELLSLLADDKNIKLKCEISDSQAFGSKELMKRAFFNLVENAVKFSPENSQVKVRLTESEFCVEDSAKPIDESQREEILKPFHRLESSESGAGLGLSLVSWIVKIHGFRLQVESLESGNSFRILLKEKN